MVAKMHVYQLAEELGLSSKLLMAYLPEVGTFVPSIASPLSPETVQAVRNDPPNPDTLQVHLSEEYPEAPLFYTDSISPETAQDLLDVHESAIYARTTPAVIRQWASRGHINRTETRDNRALYLRADIQRAAHLVRSRRNRPAIARPRGLRSQDLDALITTEEASRLAKVSPATIRVWAHRGRLEAATTNTRPQLYRLGDVLQAQLARKSRRL